VKKVQRRANVRKEGTEQKRVETKVGGGSTRASQVLLKTVGSTHLVGGIFGNGRSSDCCAWGSLGEERLARRRGDLQQLLSLHSRKDAMSVLGEAGGQELSWQEGSSSSKHQDQGMGARESHGDRIVSTNDQDLPFNFQTTPDQDLSFPVLHDPTKSLKESSLSVSSSPDSTPFFPVPQVSTQTVFPSSRLMKYSPQSSSSSWCSGTQISEQSFLENMFNY